MAQRLATVDDLPKEFESLSNDEAVFWLDIAARKIGVDVYGEDASYAHAMLTAHLLKRLGMGTNPVSGAPITARRVFDVSESYAVATTPDELRKTAYGSAFLALERQQFVGPIAV